MGVTIFLNVWRHHLCERCRKSRFGAFWSADTTYGRWRWKS